MFFRIVLSPAYLITKAWKQKMNFLFQRSEQSNRSNGKACLTPPASKKKLVVILANYRLYEYPLCG